MTGVIIVVLLTICVLAFGFYRRAVDGRVQTIPSCSTPGAVASPQNGPLTVLQFSSEFCAPCRRARAVLTDLIRGGASVRHVEVDVAQAPELVTQYEVNRTPTIVVLDADNVVHHRVVGELRPTDFERALSDLGAFAPVNR